MRGWQRGGSRPSACTDERLNDSTQVGNSVASVKASKGLRGRSGNYTRNPLPVAHPEQEQRIRELLQPLAS